MNIFKKIDNYLLINRPEIWLSRIHFIIPGIIIIFLLELLLARMVPLSMNLLILSCFLVTFFLLFLVAWCRFQKQYFEQNFSPSDCIRLYLCNTLCILLLMGLLGVIPFIVSSKISKIDYDRISNDLTRIRIDNVSDDQIYQIKQYSVEAFDSARARLSIYQPDPVWVVNNKKYIDHYNSTNPVPTYDNVEINEFLTTAFSEFDNAYGSDSLIQDYTITDSVDISAAENMTPLTKGEVVEQLTFRKNIKYLGLALDILILKSMNEINEIKRSSTNIYARYGFSINRSRYAYDRSAYFKELNSQISTLYFNKELIERFIVGVWPLYLLLVLGLSFLSISVLLNKNIIVSILSPFAAIGFVFLLALLYSLITTSTAMPFAILLAVLFIFLMKYSIENRPTNSLFANFKLQVSNYIAVAILPAFFIAINIDHSIFEPISNTLLGWICVALFFLYIIMNFFFIRKYHLAILKPQK